MSPLLGSEDHWFTVVVATIIVVVSFVIFSVPWYWALIIGMIVSGIIEFAIKEIPPNPDAYDSNEYQLWEKAFGDSQNDTENPIAGTGTDTDEPLETLRDRYARGELTDKQFEQKVEKLLETESLEEPEERKEAQELLTEHND